jgi:serine O-acetyltransferase
MNLLATLREDLRAYEYHSHKKVRWWYIFVLPLNPALTALVILRLSQWAVRKRLSPLGRFFYVLNIYLTGCEIRPESEFGPGFFMGHPTGVMIGGVKIGRNAVIGPRVGIGGPTERGWPTIGNNVTLYMNSSVLGSVNVGDDSVIGAHALAVRDVPPGVLVLGYPARVIKRFTEEEIRRRRRPSERDQPVTVTPRG